MMSAPVRNAQASGPVLDVQGLQIDLALPDGSYPVVEGVDLRLEPGERLALVGESGSGKTVTALALLGLLPQIGSVTADRLIVAGHDLIGLPERDFDRIRGHDVAMVFQNPMSSLNPVLRVERQLMAPMRRHLRISHQQARERALDLLRQVGIPDPERCLRSYPHELSGGMRQRVMIAMALSCHPRLLLADEPTTALDVTIQAQIIQLLTDLSDNLGLACLLVTHDLGVVARFAHRVAVMYSGRIVEYAPVNTLFRTPRHPYTKALLASIPTTTRTERLHQIEGAPPGLRDRGIGCSFASRCSESIDICRSVVPPLLAIDADTLAACHVAQAASRAAASAAVPVQGASHGGS